MHTVIIISLAILCVALSLSCFLLFLNAKRKDEYINDPNASYKLLSNLCSNVHKGSDLERLLAEMHAAVVHLKYRRDNE